MEQAGATRWLCRICLVAALFGGYLLLVASVTPAEAGCGLVLAVLAGMAATAATRAFGLRLRAPADLWRWSTRFPGAVAVSFSGLARLSRSAVKGEAGTVGSAGTVSVPVGDGGGADDAARGYAVLVLSVAPDTYVIRADDDPHRCRLRVHRLGEASALEKAVAR